MADRGWTLEFTLDDDDAARALHEFAARALPAFERFGYEVEGAGNSWAHWVRHADTTHERLVRALVFLHEGEWGIWVLAAGPPALADALTDLIANQPGWHARPPLPSSVASAQEIDRRLRAS